MAEDQPGPPGSSDHEHRPGQQPNRTEPLGVSARPPSASPAFAAAGPPHEALAGLWRRLVGAFLDWILIGILAAAIGDLFGVEPPSPSAEGGVSFGPFILVELAYFTYFTYFHATSAGQSIGNKIMGSGCWTPTPAAPCPMPGRSSGPS
jgi:RDD family